VCSTGIRHTIRQAQNHSFGLINLYLGLITLINFSNSKLITARVSILYSALRWFSVRVGIGGG